MSLDIAPLGSFRWAGGPRFTLAPDHWGVDLATSTGLTLGIIGGPAINASGETISASDQTVTLTDNATNYVERTYAGVVSARLSAFTVTNIAMHVAVTAGGVITSLTSLRSPHGPLPYFTKRSTERGVVAAGDTLTVGTEAVPLLTFDGTTGGTAAARAVAIVAQPFKAWLGVTADGTISITTGGVVTFSVSQEILIDTRFHYHNPRRFRCDPTKVTPCNVGFAAMRASYAAIAPTPPGTQLNPIVWPEGIFRFTEEPAPIFFAQENISGIQAAHQSATMFVFDPTTAKVALPTAAVTSASNRASTSSDGLSDVTIGTLVDASFVAATTNPQRNLSVVAGVLHRGTVAGSGTVSCVAGAASFSLDQRHYIQNGSIVTAPAGDCIVSGVTDDPTNTTTVFSCTLSGAPTFGASAFTVGPGSFIADGIIPDMLVTIAGYNTGTDGDYRAVTVSATDITTDPPLAGTQTQPSSGVRRTITQSVAIFENSILEIVGGTGAGQKRTIRKATLTSGLTFLVDAWQEVPDATSTSRVCEHRVLWDFRPNAAGDLNYRSFLRDFTVSSTVADSIPITAIRIVGGHQGDYRHLRVCFNDANDVTSQGIVSSGWDESTYSDYEIIAARPLSFQRAPGYTRATGVDTTVFHNGRYQSTPSAYGNTRVASGTIDIDMDGTVRFSLSKAGVVAAGDIITLGAGTSGAEIVTLSSFNGTTGGTAPARAVAVVAQPFNLAWRGTAAGVEVQNCALSRVRFTGLHMVVGGQGAIHCVTQAGMESVDWGHFQYEMGDNFPKIRPSANLYGGTGVWTGKLALGGYSGQTIMKARSIAGLTLGACVFSSGDGSVCAPFDVDGTVDGFTYDGMVFTGEGRPAVEPPLPNPLAPTITRYGSDGAITDVYAIVARPGSQGTTAPSVNPIVFVDAAAGAGATSKSYAVLDGTHYNILTWPEVVALSYSSLASYDVYRTATTRAATTGSMSLTATTVLNADGSYTTTYTSAVDIFVSGGFGQNMTLIPAGFAHNTGVKLVATVAVRTLVMQAVGTGWVGTETVTTTLTAVSIGKITGDAGVTPTSGTVTYHDIGALGDGTTPPTINTTGLHLASASGRLAPIGGSLYRSARYTRNTLQQTCVVAGRTQQSFDLVIPAGTSVLLDTQGLQTAGSGDILEIEAAWSQGSSVTPPTGYGRWLMSGLNVTGTRLSRLVEGSADASDSPLDPNCISVVCSTEGDAVLGGYAQIANTKTVARTVHVTAWSAKGSATADTTDGVQWPQRRFRAYTEACYSPAIDGSGVLTLDLSARNNFRVARGANITSIVLTGVPTMPASSSAMQQILSFTLMLDSTGTYTVALPTSPVWRPITGVAATFSGTGKSDMMTVWTTDNVTWYYSIVGGGSTA